MNVEARAVRGSSPDRAMVFVSLTDDAGKAIADLQADDLSVHALGAAAVSRLTLAEVARPGDGIYGLEILPPGPGPDSVWGPGEHVLAVVVRRGFDKGQSLVVLAIP